MQKKRYSFLNKLARKDDVFYESFSIQDELQLFSEELYRHLTPLFWDSQKKLDFVKRKRKFSGNEISTNMFWVSQHTQAILYSIMYPINAATVSDES
ncbi:hypothetical protein CW304_22165 [Bacillus sp. UFRGS-B20]|nr:hypothetical protein CW304_22165 [Bacillus sp. UFRGS-B20]